METQDENNLDLPSYNKNKIDQLLTESERRKQWRQEIEANQTLQEFFKEYTPTSVSQFIEHILTYKNMWIEYGPNYLKSMENEGITWVNIAFTHLGIILQKKLFDIQCLWRANEIKIAEVDVSFDFIIWERDILNCPFIEPISQDDIQFYSNYLLQADFEQDDYFGDWQSYEILKDAYLKNDDDSNFPDWYEYYNIYQGTGTLMTLPDSRGEAESFYISIANQHKAATKQKEPEENKPVFNKYLSSDKETMDWYISNFEPKEIQKLYKAFEWFHQKRESKEDIENSIELLCSAEEPVAIDAHYNFKEAINKAAMQYRHRKIVEALPLAWEQYNMYKQTGIGFSGNNRHEFGYQEMKNNFIEVIIKGRLLNGEPGNLEF